MVVAVVAWNAFFFRVNPDELGVVLRFGEYVLLERVAEQACGDTWRNIKDDLRRIKLAQLLSPNGTVWQITEPAPGALKRLKSLKIQKPPPILHLA